MVDLRLTDCPSIFIQNPLCSKGSYAEYKLTAGFLFFEMVAVCMLMDWICLFESLFIFLFFKAWLDLSLNSAIFTALIIHKGSPWARKKIIKLDIYGILKPGILSTVSLQAVHLENLREIFLMGSCINL